MKPVLWFVVGIIIGCGAGLIGGREWGNKTNPGDVRQAVDEVKVKPLEKYGIENLGKREYSSRIYLDEAVATNSAYVVQRFHFDSDGKRVNGLAHIPSGPGKFAVILQVRGYMDAGSYNPGDGTRRSAAEFAKGGFISLAPDYLGYGESENPSSNVFESRFETYTTTLNLLAGIKTLTQADPDRVGIWGHSNGGQIALTALEITQRPYPTVLWAPVSAPFPYSILYFTDDTPDHGKELRKRLAEFEAEYDVEKYTLINYWDRIAAPVLVLQGGKDDSVPQKWSDNLVDNLRLQGKEVEYKVFPGADHNLMPDWEEAVGASAAFFTKNL